MLLYMIIKGLKTNILKENDNLLEFIKANLQSTFKQKAVLVVTSKLVSLSQGLTISKDNTSKEELIKKECDEYLGEGLYGHHLTIKNNLLMPTAGIDSSNSESDRYILLPRNIHGYTKNLHQELSSFFDFNNWGLIISDSKTTPLRRGVTGAALSYHGFQGVTELKGQIDLFGKRLRVTSQNRVDALAAAAVFEMGESNEQTPICIITEAKLNFTTDNGESVFVDKENDIYSPLYIDKIIQH